MAGTRFKIGLERTAVADIWRRTLSQIPTTFGRLVYLASLRNQNTGKYEHHGLTLMFDAHDSDKALRKSHRMVFEEWLGYSLEEQKADLDLYIAGVDVDRRQIFDTWARTAPFSAILPASAIPAERMLFAANFDSLFSLLKNLYGVVFPDQDA